MSDTRSPLDNLSDLALDQVSDPIVITEANLDHPGGPRIIYVNQAMLDLTGYNREDVLGQSPKMFQGKETDREASARIIRQLQSGKKTKENILNYTKDGSPYWTELNISPIRDDKGMTVAFLSIQHDLTAFQKAKEQYERELRLISTGEKIARVGTWGYDIVENKMIWSNGTYDIWEWELGTSPPSVEVCNSFVDEPDRTMLVALHEACIHTHAPYNVEVRAHSSKGTPLRLKVLCESLVDKDGKTYALVGAIRDITNEKRIEDELDETKSLSRQTEQHFSIARAIAKIGVFDYWVEHDRLHWSDELIEMSGLSPDLFPLKVE